MNNYRLTRSEKNIERNLLAGVYITASKENYVKVSTAIAGHKHGNTVKRKQNRKTNILKT